MKYSKTKFDGYTHRFKIKFQTSEWYPSNIDIYSDSDSYQKMEDFINEKKTDQVIAFDIVNRSTKEQDERAESLIEETLSGI